MFYSERSFRRDIDGIAGVRQNLHGEAYLASPQKRLVDSYGACALRCATEPIVQAARLAVCVADGGRGIIGVPRVGVGGVEFKQYKLRTMTSGTERLAEVLRTKTNDDSRVTQVGRILRRWSLDELPQFRNVQEGTMSLVGSRPRSRVEFDAYGQIDDGFQTAYTAGRPGMTGLEQIGGRANMSVEERIEATKQYAEEASLALDTDILFKTVGAVLSREGAY